MSESYFAISMEKNNPTIWNNKHLGGEKTNKKNPTKPPTNYNTVIPKWQNIICKAAAEHGYRMQHPCRLAGSLCLPQAVALGRSYLQLHIWLYSVDYSYLKVLNSCSNYLHFWPPQCSMYWDSVMCRKKQGSFFLQGSQILNMLPNSFMQHLLALQQPFPPLLYFAHLLCHIS